MRGGQHVAVGGDREATAGTLGNATPAGASRDGEVRHGGREPLRDPGDRAGVGVERVGVRQSFGGPGRNAVGDFVGDRPQASRR